MSETWEPLGDVIGRVLIQSTPATSGDRRGSQMSLRVAGTFPKKVSASNGANFDVVTPLRAITDARAVMMS